jgi:hypothetical protein
VTKIAIGQYAPDIESFDQGSTDYVRNVVPTPNGFGPMYDLQAISAALGARCLGAFGCLDDDNASHVFAGTATALYKLDATARTWAEVTRASGGAYSLADREYWAFAQFGSNIVAVASGNNPQLYTLGSSTDFADLGGSPPQARGVTVVGDFLVLYGLTSNPNRIQWSGLNEITTWTPGTASSDFQDFPDGGYVRGVGGGEFGIVLQDAAIRRMIFNPGAPTIFDFSRVADDTGILMPYSLVPSGNSLYFFAHDGFYRIDGTGQITPVGAGRVDLTIVGELDPSNPRFMVGAADPANHRIVWAYKSKDNLDTAKLDRLIVYDWALDRWGAGDCSLEYLTSISPLGATLEGLDAVATLDALPYSLDSYETTPAYRLAGLSTSHVLGFFDGASLEATLDTPEGTLGEGYRMKVRAVAPLTDATGAMVRTSVRETLQAAKTYSSEQGTSARSGYAGARGSGRFVAARIRIPAGTSWTFLRGVEVDAVKTGRL